MNNVQLSGKVSDVYYDNLMLGGRTTPYFRAILSVSGKRSSLRLPGIRVVFYGGMAKLARVYLHPGSGLFVQGHLQSRKIEKNGLTTLVFEVVVEDFTPLDNTNRDEGNQLYAEMMANGEIEAVPSLESFQVAYESEDREWN